MSETRAFNDRAVAAVLGAIAIDEWFEAATVSFLFALTFAGHASLWAAIAADMGVTLLVVTNALRLLAISTAAVEPQTT